MIQWQLFRETKFRHDCLITLTKNDGRITFQGPGELWQEADGALAFKCFCHDKAGYAVGELFRQMAFPRGKLLKKDAYYSVLIVMRDGSEWRAENFWLEPPGYSAVINLAVAGGKLKRLKQVQQLSRPSEYHTLRLLFMGEPLRDWRAFVGSEISCSRIGCEIKVIKERDSDLLVEVKSKSRLARNFEDRIVEALRYILARVVHPSVIERRADGVLETELISPTPLFATRLHPPLSAESAIHHADIRRLFQSYLIFVHSNTSPDSPELVHPCSAHLRAACEASANSIEAGATELCVAVEGIAKLIKYERSGVDDAAIARIQRTVCRWLDKRQFNDRLANRVRGALRMLSDPNVPLRLERLTQSGHLDPSCVSAWNTLRHKMVHGATLDLRDDRASQELLDKIHKIYAGMYQITFALIGYEGMFSNYAKEDFPVERYPFARETSEG